MSDLLLIGIFSALILLAGLAVALLRWARSSVSQPAQPRAQTARRDVTAVPPDAEAQARALAAQGRLIEAVKVVRMATGMGLREAKDYVDALPRDSQPMSGLRSGSLRPGVTGLDPAALAEVRDALARGNKIEAIKLAREHSGMGLKEAKDYVEALPATGISPGAKADAPPPPGAANLDPATEDAIRRLARVNKIEAIKLVRQNTGWGLKQAKDYVDGL